MTRIMRTTGVLVVPLLAAMSTQAQVTFGPRIGLNLSNVSYDYGSFRDENNSKFNLLPGAQIGLALNAQFGALALQPALLFTMKGSKFKAAGSNPSFSYTSKGSTRYNYAELPVNLVYSTKGAEGGFQVFAGPYVALGLSGKAEGESARISGGVTQTKKEEIEVAFVRAAGSEPNTVYVRNYDYGLNAGVGYKIGGVQAQVGYGLGIGNCVPRIQAKASDTTVRHRSLQFSLTYLI